jgi:hypothetical protein
MAALLSATAEKNPAFAWDLNMNSLFHVLNLAKAGRSKKYFGHLVLPFWSTTKEKHRNTRSWSRLPCMESVKAGEDGASTTTISLASMYAVFDIRFNKLVIASGGGTTVMLWIFSQS